MANRYTCLWLACAGMASAAWAGSAQDLGTTLTPLGGDKAGNAARTIPAWSAENVQLPGWSAGKYRKDYFKYKDDKVVETIDAANVDKYAEHLTPGQIALFKQKTAYEIYRCDWSSDVCSSDLPMDARAHPSAPSR